MDALKPDQETGNNRGWLTEKFERLDCPNLSRQSVGAAALKKSNQAAMESIFSCIAPISIYDHGP
jgi:hypothetical protein